MYVDQQRYQPSTDSTIYITEVISVVRSILLGMATRYLGSSLLSSSRLWEV
jgi:hypothetical protein